jgi:hypothetical protein
MSHSWADACARYANPPAPMTVLTLMGLYASLRGMVETIMGGDRDFSGRAERVRAVPLAELRLPTADEVLTEHRRAAQVIERWLADAGLGDAGLGDRWPGLSAEPPASDVAIQAFEAREGFVAPTAYRALLRVANGVDLGHITVLGTSDVYRLDMPGPSRLVISPPDGRGTVVLRESGAVEWIDLDDPAGIGQILAVDLRTWVVDRLTWSRSALVAG